MYENARKYGLTGTDAMVFEALVFLCAKTGECRVSYAKLAAFSLCGTRQNACCVVERLIKRGLVSKDLTGVLKILTEVSNIVTNDKEKRTKKENNNSIKVQVSPSLKGTDNTHAREDGRTDSLFSEEFIKFWSAYKPLPKYNNRKGKCYEQWKKMPPDWQKRAISTAQNHEVDTNPFFWLQEEVFLRDTEHITPTNPVSPHWLNGAEQDKYLDGGTALAVCKNPETGLFGTVTKEEAEKFKLEILRFM